MNEYQKNNKVYVKSSLYMIKVSLPLTSIRHQILKIKKGILVKKYFISKYLFVFL